MGLPERGRGINSVDQFPVVRFITERRKSREAVLNPEMGLMPIFCAKGFVHKKEI